MSQLPLMQTVRGMIREEFHRLGAAVEEVRETIMVRDSVYCGRKFRCAGFQAVWFAEEREIKFFLPSGDLSHVINPESHQEPPAASTEAAA